MLENYPVAGHLPFIFATVIYPLIVELGLTVYHAWNLAREGRSYEPYTGFYTMLLIAMAVLELWFTIFLYKAALDSTYLRAYTSPMGTVVTWWRTVADHADLAVVTRIVNALTPYYFLAGLATGLSLVPALLRRLHSLWYVETPLMAAGPLMFTRLEASPLEKMRFSLALARELGAGGESVYSFLARGPWVRAFAAGLLLGLAASLGVYLWYRRRIRGA